METTAVDVKTALKIIEERGYVYIKDNPSLRNGIANKLGPGNYRSVYMVEFHKLLIITNEHIRKVCAK